MSYQTVNPATGALVETFASISDHELERVLATAHNTFETDWRKRTVAERARIVSRAAAILREKADEYAGYLTLEMGKRRRVISSRGCFPRHLAPNCTPLPSECCSELNRGTIPITRSRGWRDLS